MAEPAATVLTTGATVSMISLFGVSLGLQPVLLIAGAFGAFVGIALLNTVPSDATAAWWLTALRRIVVMLASAVTAGYLTPVVLALMSLAEPVQYGIAFVVGGSAQWSMQAAIKRVTRTVEGAA